MISYQRGYGHIPNPPDSRDLHLAALVQQYADPAPLPESVDNSMYLGDVRDQSISSSCVAHAVTKSIFGFCRARGLTCPELAALPTYALTRGLSMLTGDPLVDDGSVPRDAFRTAAIYGVVAEYVYPFDAGKVNDKLPLDVYEAGVAAKVGSYHTLFESGPERVLALRQAIAAKLFPTFAMPVDLAFERLEDDGIYPGITGAVKGQHDQVLCGYGPGYFLVRGSWGLAFGFGGCVRISSDFIGSDECSDFMAADAAPKGSQ